MKATAENDSLATEESPLISLVDGKMKNEGTHAMVVIGGRYDRKRNL